MRLILYARKSSEGEDRQVQSLDDQTRLLRIHAQKQAFLVVEELAESKSAKDPYRRPLFEHMLDQIEKGEADGILCWHLNRLFRNLVDSGRVGHLLQQGRIQAIETPERTYLPEDNVLLFSVESGMANQYIRELSKGVRRGMASKVEKGWAPQVAPPGYLNDIYSRTIAPDPERFDLLRQAWDLMLSNTVTVPQMLTRLNDEWGFRTRQEHRRGGKPLSRQAAYRMLHSVFYTGNFVRSGGIHPGRHPAMVTQDEWERVQERLAEHGDTRPRKRPYAYTGLIRCGRCGCRVTAEISKSRIYYHCTNGRGICDKRGVTEAQLEDQISLALESVRLSSEVEDLLLSIITRWQQEPSRDAEQRYAQLHRSLEVTRSQQRELVGLRLRKVIDDTLLLSEQERLSSEIRGLEREISLLETAMTRQVESALRSIHFATHAQARFTQGDTETRRWIARTLGVEYTLIGKHLSVKKHPLLEFIGENQEVMNIIQNTPQPQSKPVKKEAIDLLKVSTVEPVKTRFESQKKGDLKPSVSFGRTDNTLIDLCQALMQLAREQSALFPVLP